MDAQVLIINLRRYYQIPKVKLSEVKAYHNHRCNIAGAVVSYKKSDKCAEEAISQVTKTKMLAPLTLSKRPVSCNLIWWTIKPHLSTGILLDSKAIGNIMRGVRAQIESGSYTSPPPIIDADVMRVFTTVDITSDNCGKVLQKLISNSNGENSWTTSCLMNRLKEKNPD